MSWAPPAEDQDTLQGWQPPAEDKDISPSIGGFAKNLGTDVVENVKGLGNLAKGLVTEPINTLSSIPGAVVNEAKRVGAGELLTGHPINAAEKLGGAFYNKPLTTGLDFAALLGAGEGVMGKAGELGEVAEKSAPIAEEAAKAAPATEDVSRMAPSPKPPINLPPEAANILKESPKTAPPIQPETSTLNDLVDKIKGAIPKSVTDPMEEVKQYLTRQYGKVSEKPSFAKTAADYLDRYAQNMSLKNMGGSPLQVKQIGPEAGRALGKYAMEKEITSPTVGSIGMEEKVSQINNMAGQQINALRKVADTRGAPPPIEDITNIIKSKLDSIYTKGIESGQKSSYMKALSELKRAESSHEGLADLSTTLNHSATAANRLNQASGAITDVANEVRNINHTSISKLLTPEELQAYETALKDYGATKKIQQFMIRKGSREAAGRLGPGGGIRQIVQNFLDGFGYKSQAKIASKMADFIRRNPQKVSDLPSLFKEFVNQVEDIGSDMTDATH